MIRKTLPLMLLVALPATVQCQAPPAVPADAPYRVVTVAEGLQNPWSIAFLPGGEILVTERPGDLRVIRDGVLQPEPVRGVPEVRAQGQGGLMDVVPHPEFVSNRLVYLSYSKPNTAGQGTTAVVRGRFDGTELSDVEEIFEARAWSAGGNHFGSRLVFDRDGYLFITIGDRGASPVEGPVEAHPAQDLTNHQGTIVRLHDDGRVPEDNPFVGRTDVLPEIWSYGHRSPQGLALHPETGDLWETEHGPQGGDELNLIQPGLNYGWPVVGHGVNYGGAVIHAAEEREGMESPVHHWTPSIATSGLMIYSGDRFPQWRGDFFVGGLQGQQLARLTMSGREVDSEETLLQGLGRIRDVRQGPDGFIYLAIDGRGAATDIVRLEPAEND